MVQEQVPLDPYIIRYLSGPIRHPSLPIPSLLKLPPEGVKFSDVSSESRGYCKAYVQIHLKKGKKEEKNFILKVQESESSGLCRGIQLSHCCTGSVDLHVCEGQ